MISVAWRHFLRTGVRASPLPQLNLPTCGIPQAGNPIPKSAAIVQPTERRSCDNFLAAQIRPITRALFATLTIRFSPWREMPMSSQGPSNHVHMRGCLHPLPLAPSASAPRFAALSMGHVDGSTWDVTEKGTLMNTIAIRLPYAGLATALLLSGCYAAPPENVGGAQPAATDVSVPLPSYYGLYAINQNALVRLDGSSGWERQTWTEREDLAPQVRFLAFNRDLGLNAQPLDRSITLSRVASLRDDATAVGTETPHPPGSVWVTPDLPAYQIPLEFEPVPDHPEMVIAQPESPLPPGLYSLKLHGNDVVNSRFGVAWSSVQQRQYAAQYCVDHYPGGYQSCATAAPGGTTVGTTTLATAPAASEVRFAVRDLHSARSTSGDGSPDLVIEGELVNTSQVQAILPALSATLLDGEGRVVQVLPSVTLSGPPLDPGGTYNFRINVANPAPGASQVRVAPIA